MIVRRTFPIGSVLVLAMVMGTGFPPFRGGLLRYADALGGPYILGRLDELSARVGALEANVAAGSPVIGLPF